VFALDEGDVVITFPETLSADSFADLKAYLGCIREKGAAAFESAFRAE
jgi:hypothetical protein